MVTLSLRAPGLDPVHTEKLGQGESLLVGRDPKPPGESTVVGYRHASRLVRIDSRTTSSNHLLAWHAGEDLVVKDLGSTNGTKLRLPPHAEVRIPAAAGDLTLDLGEVAPAMPDVEPREATWSSEVSFAQAVTARVEEWLSATRAKMKVELMPRTKATTPNVIALGNGDAIRLFVPETGNTWLPLYDRMFEQVSQYVDAQRARLRAEERILTDPSRTLSSPAMVEAVNVLLRAASRGLRVLLLGETGVGKSTFAQLYHEQVGGGGRRPLVQFNCATLSGEMAVSTLFGAPKGAFSSSVAEITGLVEAAHGGTLFLDEVAELPASVQAMLLTFLDTGKYYRLNDPKPRSAKPLVLAATSRDTKDPSVFNQALRSRLASVVVRIPPLRDRKPDIEAYLMRATVEWKGRDRDLFELLTNPARKYLVDDYKWPANFRELVAFPDRLSVVVPHEAEQIERDHCHKALHMDEPSESVHPSSALGGAPESPLFGSASLEDLADIVPGALRALSGKRRSVGAEMSISSFVDQFVKPMLVARFLGIASPAAIPERMNREQAARKLGLGDGKSVKDLLELYKLMHEPENPTTR